MDFLPRGEERERGGVRGESSWWPVAAFWEEAEKEVLRLSRSVPGEPWYGEHPGGCVCVCGECEYVK